MGLFSDFKASLMKSDVLSLATAVVIGGAFGNLADRIFRGDGWLHGHVVDFIDFQWFAVFNIADSAITVGAGVLIIGLFREYMESKRLERHI
jgi:signal peptidase II